MLKIWNTERHKISCKFLCSLLTPGSKVLPEELTADQGVQMLYVELVRDCQSLLPGTK
jgi:hypothetical protein